MFSLGEGGCSCVMFAYRECMSAEVGALRYPSVSGASDT